MFTHTLQVCTQYRLNCRFILRKNHYIQKAAKPSWCKWVTILVFCCCNWVSYGICNYISFSFSAIYQLDFLTFCLVYKSVSDWLTELKGVIIQFFLFKITAIILKCYFMTLNTALTFFWQTLRDYSLHLSLDIEVVQMDMFIISKKYANRLQPTIMGFYWFYVPISIIIWYDVIWYNMIWYRHNDATKTSNHSCFLSLEITEEQRPHLSGAVWGLCPFREKVLP